MKLTSILAGTAIASLAMFSDLGGSLPFHAVSQAEAATSVSFSVFYNKLGSHGSWVNYNNDYVFIPSGVRTGWRPYTDGHWVFVKEYGWTWASDEPFGWATYHYGRWGYAEDIGWYWVPGTRWAPAWVSWRRSNDYVVWAPLPPRRGGGGNADVSVSVRINAGDIPDFYWVAVPTKRFLEPNLTTVVIRDRSQERTVIERTKFVGVPKVQNNIVINNVIDVNVIERDTGRKVRRVEARTTTNPDEARAGDDQVTVFRGEISRDQKAKPDKVQEVTQVKKVKRNGAEGDTATDQNATSPSDTTGTATQAPAEDNNNAASGNANGNANQPADNTASGTAKQKPSDTGTAAEGNTGTDTTTGTADTTGNGKLKKKNQQGTESGSASTTTDENSSTKKSATEDNQPSTTTGAASEDQSGTDTGTNAQKKRKKAQGSDSNATQDQTGAADQTDTNAGQGKKPNKKAQSAPADQPSGSTAEDNSGQGQKKKPNKKAQGAESDSGDATGSATVPSDQGNGNAKKAKGQDQGEAAGKKMGKKGQCDPSVQDCGQSQ